MPKVRYDYLLNELRLVDDGGGGGVPVTYSLADATTDGLIQSTGGVINRGKSPVVNSTGTGYENVFGFTTVNIVPPELLPIALPNYDIATPLNSRQAQTPIIVQIIENSAQDNIDIVNAGGVLSYKLVKEGVVSTVTTYNAKAGEVLVMYKDSAGTDVVQVLPTIAGGTSNIKKEQLWGGYPG